MTELDKLNRKLEFTFKWGVLVSVGAMLTGVLTVAALLNVIIALILDEGAVFNLSVRCTIASALLSVGLKSLSDLSEYYVDKYKALIKDQKNKTTP